MAHVTEVEPSDRIKITRVGAAGAEWALYVGATGVVTDVRHEALIVDWDDPGLAEHEVPLLPGVGDRWKIVTGHGGRRTPSRRRRGRDESTQLHLEVAT